MYPSVFICVHPWFRSFFSQPPWILQPAPTPPCTPVFLSVLCVNVLAVLFALSRFVLSRSPVSLHRRHHHRLGILAPPLHLNLPVRPHRPGHHPGSIERRRRIPVPVQRDHTRLAMLLRKLLHHPLIRRLPDRHVQVPHPLANIRRHHVAHEIFAHSGPRYRAALV